MLPSDRPAIGSTVPSSRSGPRRCRPSGFTKAASSNPTEGIIERPDGRSTSTLSSCHRNQRSDMRDAEMPTSTIGATQLNTVAPTGPWREPPITKDAVTHNAAPHISSVRARLICLNPGSSHQLRGVVLRVYCSATGTENKERRSKIVSPAMANDREYSSNTVPGPEFARNAIMVMPPNNTTAPASSSFSCRARDEAIRVTPAHIVAVTPAHAAPRPVDRSPTAKISQGKNPKYAFVPSPVDISGNDRYHSHRHAASHNQRKPAHSVPVLAAAQKRPLVVPFSGGCPRDGVTVRQINSPA